MTDAKRKCVLCNKQLGDDEECEDREGERGEPEFPSQDWCIVIQRENDDLVLTLRDFRRELP